MTANASKSKDNELSVLAPLSEKIAESVLFLMQLVGLKKISCTRIKVSELEKISSDIEFFEGAPDQIRTCGYILKDSLSEILAASGIVSIDINASKDEIDLLVKNYISLANKISEKKIPPEYCDQPEKKEEQK